MRRCRIGHILTAFGVLLLLHAELAAGQSIITRLAGNGNPGTAAEGLPALSLALGPFSIAVGPNDDIYFTESNQYQVRRLDRATGLVWTVARDIVGLRGIAVDAHGNVYVSEALSNLRARVLRIDSVTGAVTTVAGTGAIGSSGDGGLATSATLTYPAGLALDDAGNLFIADQYAYRVRRVDARTGIITTVAGNGQRDSVWGFRPATTTAIGEPTDVAVDGEGTMYIVDRRHHALYRVSPSGILTFFAGGGGSQFSGDGGPAWGAGLNSPEFVALDQAGNIYIGDVNNRRVRRVDATGTIATVAGNGTSSYSGDGGPATAAGLAGMLDIAADRSGRLILTDLYTLRAVTTTFPVTAPSVGSIAPASGLSRGGTVVTIEGNNFNSQSRALIGGKPLTNVSVTATAISGTVPSLLRGSHDVVISNPGGVYGRLANGFNSLNTPPRAESSGQTVLEGGVVQGRLRATDHDRDSLTFAIQANGTKGVASITNPATGAYTYEPSADQTGVDTFTFTAHDGFEASEVATITVTIRPPSRYVAYFGGEGSNLGIFDTTDVRHLASVEIPRPRVLSPGVDGARVFALSRTNIHGEFFTTIDTAASRTIGSFRIVEGSEDFVLSASGETFFTTNQRRIDEIDIATGTVLRGLDIAAYTLERSPDGSELYAGGPGTTTPGVLHVIDAGSLTVVASLAMRGGRPIVAPDGQRLYLPFQGGIEIVDVHARQVVDTIFFAWEYDYVRDMVITADGNTAFAAMQSGLVKLDLLNRAAVVAQIPLSADAIAVTPDGLRLVAVNHNHMYGIDTSSMAITHTTTNGGYTRAIVVPVPREGVFVSPVTTPYNSSVTLRASLLRHGFGVPAKTLTFALGGVEVGSAMTDSDGVAQLTGVPVSPRIVGLYSSEIVAAFAGDEDDPASARSHDLTIVKAIPTITWAPAPLMPGQAITANQLNAVADTAGTFTYYTSLGTVVQVGLHYLVTTFTPDDLDNYVETTATIYFAVNLQTATSSPTLVDPLVVDGGQSDGAFDITTDRLFMVDDRSASIKVIQASTHQVLQSLTLASARPVRIALDASGRRLFVADLDSTLWVIDVDTFVVLEQLSLDVISGPLVFNPASGRLYVSTAQAVTSIDFNLAIGAPGRVSTIEVDDCVWALTPNATTGLIYLHSGCAGTVSVIDGNPASPTFHEVQTLLSDVNGTAAIAVNRKTNRVYVTEMGDTRLDVLDGDPMSATFHTVIDSFQIGHPYEVGPIAITTNPVTNRIYVYLGDPVGFSNGQARLDVLDGLSHEVLSATVLPYIDHYFSSGRVFVDPATDRVYLTTHNGKTTVVQDHVVAALSTPSGESGQAVTVQSEQAGITFAAVTSGGTTTIETIDAADLDLELSGQFSLDGARAYEISTTAGVVPPIAVCFNVASVDDPELFASLRVLHGENGVLVDRTSSRDFATGTLCASVDSLSPFVIATGARGAVQRLIRQVTDLGATRKLTRGQTNSLTAKLAAAVQQLDKGNPSTARLQLESFVNELRGLVGAQRVSEPTALPLLTAAAEIAARL